MINFQTMTEEEYSDLRYNYLLQIEELGIVKTNPYYDSRGIFTIGVGFNIENSDVLDVVLNSWGFDREQPAHLAYINSIQTTISTASGTLAELQTALNDIMVASDAVVGHGRSVFAFNDSADVKVTFDALIEDYEDDVDGYIAGIPDSNERLALVSLAYNNQELLGQHLKTAISAGNRAEAWFEIRYNSNINSLAPTPPEDAPGIAKRRYVESKVFGLYDQVNASPGDLAQDDALSVFRMFNIHEKRIREYEERYSGQRFIDANAALAAIQSQTGQDFGVVADFATEFATAFEHLSATFLSLDEGAVQKVTDNGTVQEVNLGAALWGSGAGALRSVLDAVRIRLQAQGKDTAGLDTLLGLEGNLQGIFAAASPPADPEKVTASELAANTVDRASLETFEVGEEEIGPTNDLIFGTSDADTLLAGGGDDAIVGDAGGDLIDGGDGIDTVIYVNSASGVAVDLTGETGSAGDAAGDTLRNLENVIGSAQNDSLKGNDQNNVLIGIGGSDTFIGSAGNDTLIGGDGSDTVNYSDLAPGNPNGIRVDIVLDTSGNGDLSVAKEGMGTDTVAAVETVITGKANDTFEVTGSVDALSDVDLTVDAADGKVDELDLSGLDGPVQVKSVASNVWQIRDTDIYLKNFERLTLTSQADEVRFDGTMWMPGVPVPPDGIPSYLIDGGLGNDTITVNAAGATILGGEGSDTIEASGWGTMVFGGGGADIFHLGFNVGILDASAEDKIYFGGVRLQGAGRHAESESAWAVDNSGFKYAKNVGGELIIRAAIPIPGQDFDTYISNYTGGPGIADDTLGIETYEYDIDFYRLLDPNLPSGSVASQLALLDKAFKDATGEKRRPGADPLVLDLDGDGIELAPQTSVSPYFDTDGDGFAERTGWVMPGDGFLARDLDGNGQIDDVSELFGNAAQDGFSELATLDSNGDGVIDASDTGWSTLRVWQDLDQDGETDAGELSTLDDEGIASIDLTTTAPQDPVNNLNEITAVGSFTRTDGSTGEVADVEFRLDNYNSVYLGDTSVTAEAAALPDLKGYGTLPGLRVAMSRNTSVLTAVQTHLSGLNQPSLDVLRSAVMPILNAWASWDSATTPTYEDLAILATEGSGGQLSVSDYAIKTTDPGTGTVHYVLASGDPVLDALGDPIAMPTWQDVLAQQPTEGEWRSFTGDQIAFMERYLGEHIPTDQLSTGLAATGGIEEYLNLMVSRLDVLAVRLAVQGPLQSYFPGIEYDAESDTFKPTTDRQLIPAFEALFGAAPGDAAGATSFLESWEGFLRVVIGDFDRGSSHLNNSYAFLFSNIVAAYETIGLPIGAEAAAVALGLPDDLIIDGTGELNGTVENDIFYMHAGDQTARGGTGHDVYVFGRGFGNDVIEDIETAEQVHSFDAIRFADIASTEVTMERDGVDLIIRVDGTSDQVTVRGQFNGRTPNITGGGNLGPETWIDEIIFSDGVVWDRIDIAAAVADPQPTSDTVVGTETIDFLDGGAGDDLLQGGNDADHYVFDAGYGNDVIEDVPDSTFLSGPDMVHFGDGIGRDSISFLRDGDSDDVTLSFDGLTDTLMIKGQFNCSYTGVLGSWWVNRIDAFTFSNGDYFSWQFVTDTILAEAKTAGDDTIYGFSLEDTLDGGAGDDTLIGGNENDTYLVGLGYGHDTIDEGLDNILSGTIDTLHFLQGIDPSAVSFSRDGDSDDLEIDLTDGTSVTVKDQFDVTVTGVFGNVWFDQIEFFTFADDPSTSINYADVMEILRQKYSTDGNDQLYGFSVDDTLEAGLGDDFINGGDGNDTYVYNLGDGNDTILDEMRDVLLDRDGDRIVFGAGISPSDLTFSHPTGTDDLVIRIAQTNETITVSKQFFTDNLGNVHESIDLFEFADGTILTDAEVRELALEQAKTTGDDTIEGFFGADTLDGGLGNDRLIGGDGGDTYVFDRGYGEDVVYDEQTSIFFDQPDKVTFGPGISPSDLIVRRSGTNGRDLVFEVTGTTDKLTIEGNFFTSYLTVEEFHFDDGTIWTQETIRDLLLQGTDGDDVLIGFDTADVLDGGLGNDRLEGGDGSDTYVFDRGYGQDVVYDYQTSALSQQTDIISFGPGILPSDLTVSREGSFNRDLVFRIQGTDDSLTIEDMFFTKYTGVEEFHFSDGTVWSVQDVKDLLLASTDGDDYILGFDDSGDTLAGGLGNDTLEGLDGADTYVFNLGDGQDVVIDFQGDAFSSARDRILFGPGILPADVVFSMAGSSNQNLVITISGTTDSLTINNHFYADYYRVEDFQFDDGTVLTYEDVNSLLFGGTSSDDTLTGTSGDDVIYGYDGDDVIDGLNGDDDLFGGNGNDTIYGGYGNDWIEGGDGDDYLSAGAYNDTVLGGAGNDVVQTAGGHDFLDGGEGIDTLTLSVTYQDLRLDLETGRSIFGSYNPVILNFEHAAGSRGDDIIKGTDGANEISGGNGADTLYGRAGNDSLSGGAGNDILVGGEGDDWISGDTGTDSIDGGAGIDTADFSYSTEDWTLDLSAEQATAGTVVETITGIEHLVAGSGDDVLVGSTDDNELTGGAGDDSLDGEYGRDTAVFSGALAGYSISTAGDTVTVTDIDLTDGDDGTDTLTNIEVLRFSDGETVLVPEPDFTAEDGLASAPADTTLEGDVVVNIPEGYSGGLGFSIVTAANSGTVSVDANGHYVYAPAQGFAGSDSFEILVADDSGAERIVTISVEIRGDEPMSDASIANDISRYNMTTDSDYWRVPPRIASLEGGDYLVIWPQFDGDGYGEGVLARRYDESGNPISGEILINQARLNAQDLPDVVGLAGGGFVAVWTCDVSDGLYDGIVYRLFDADNRALGDQVVANVYQSWDQIRPSIAATEDGGFVMVWESKGPDGSGYGVCARTFSSDGTALSGEVEINAFTTNNQVDPRVAVLSGGRFVATWVSADQDGSGYGVYGRVCATDGTFVSNEFQVHEFPVNAQWEPDVVALANGGFVIVWQDGSEAFSTGSGSDIVARQFDADGVATGASFRVNSGDVAGEQLSPSVTALADGGFYVVWGSQADNSIYGQRFAADGTQVGGHEVLAQTALAEDWKPDVTVLEDGGIAISWQESLTAGGRTNVFTRVIYGDHRLEISGTDGADVLIGDDGDNILTGAAGSDHLVGGLGDDTYAFGYGDGQDVVENGDLDAATSTDRILLGDSVDTSEVWFRRDGDDLVMQLLGSDNTMTVSGWYSDDPECIDVVETSEGDTLLAGSIETLVAAMASFSVAAIESGEIETHPDYANVQALIAANWENHV